QMNPHFVFNALNAIQNFIMKSDKEAGYLYLSKFARLIRMILENSPKGTVSLEEELKMLTLYLEMESLRFDSRFVYELEVDPSLSQSVEEIPSMIIQPYVENAIVHGLLNKMDGEKGRLEISIARADQGIRCTITDNGVGRKRAEELKKKKLLTHRSVGISNTRERLEILNLERPDKTEVKTQDLVDAHNEVIGTSVELVIPLAK
ncbi:MAG: histidine kinase, partial [Bacteroidota bacterium]